MTKQMGCFLFPQNSVHCDIFFNTFGSIAVKVNVRMLSNIKNKKKIFLDLVCTKEHLLKFKV